MTDRHRILVVDTDPIVAEAMGDALTAAGHGVERATELEAAQEALRAAAAHRPFAVVVIDPSAVDPGNAGVRVLEAIRRADPAVVPVVVTGYGTIEQAVDALRHGAVDYLVKPVVDEELRLSVERAVRQHVLLAENERLRSQLERHRGLEEIIGSDARMVRIFDVIDAVAASRTTVLMNGESGTGKSLIARAIHRRSDRADGPFVEIACGSIPETLLESELFGHVQGAFTGAHVDKPGRFLAADGGTLFLDEINSASPGMQLKLLRVLQERTFEPVGSNETIEVDVRVVLASNQPLERLVEAGTFRQDLYYRIAVVTVDLPPLRDRPSDVMALAEHFLALKAAEAGRAVTGFDDAARDALRAYAWPGNVRELENVIERAVVLSRTPTVQVGDLPEHVSGRAADGTARRAPGAPITTGGASGAGGEPGAAGLWHPDPSIPLKDGLLEPERLIILEALNTHAWNRQATADALGINRTTLYKKMRQHGLDQGMGAA